MFAAWYRSEHTLSIHTIVTRRRELFYWARHPVHFRARHLGRRPSGRAARPWLRARPPSSSPPTSGSSPLLYYVVKLDEIFCFWFAYILTRPLGASMGDLLAKPQIAGGLGWGTVNTSIVFLVVIAGVVAYLTVSKADRIDPGPTGP